MLLSAGVSFFYQESDALAILKSVGITTIFGFILFITTKQGNRQIEIKEGYLITALVWIIFSFFGSLPFLLTHSIPDLTDAYFETISGFTTTGASILNNIEDLSHGILFWRSLIQWLGGMGIIVLTLAILPTLGNGLRLFTAEVPGPTIDRLSPRLRDTARRLWFLYVIITLTETLVLRFAGMPFFDAICHSFTTLATGGYSTKQASIAYYQSPAIHYIIGFFMVLAGTNYTLLYILFVKHDFKHVFRDEELRNYLKILGIATLIITGAAFFQHLDWSWFHLEESFRNAFFQVSSNMTCTGFSTYDYTLWPKFVILIILALMLCGGMIGSTSGAIKVLRVTVVFKNISSEFKRLIHPRAIIPVRLNHKVIKPHIVNSIQVYAMLYLAVAGLGVFALTCGGLTIGESVGATFTSLGGVGAGIGRQGPASNFAACSDFVKWAMSFMMVVGRLEIFTLFMLLLPKFWKK